MPMAWTISRGWTIPRGLEHTDVLDHAEGPPTFFMVASTGGLSEKYGHDRRGVFQGCGQTEAEGVSSQDERGDALLRRMSPYLT